MSHSSPYLVRHKSDQTTACRQFKVLNASSPLVSRPKKIITCVQENIAPCIADFDKNETFISEDPYPDENVKIKLHYHSNHLGESGNGIPLTSSGIESASQDASANLEEDNIYDEVRNVRMYEDRDQEINQEDAKQYYDFPRNITKEPDSRSTICSTPGSLRHISNKLANDVAHNKSYNDITPTPNTFRCLKAINDKLAGDQMGTNFADGATFRSEGTFDLLMEDSNNMDGFASKSRGLEEIIMTEHTKLPPLNVIQQPVHMPVPVDRPKSVTTTQSQSQSKQNTSTRPRPKSQKNKNSKQVIHRSRSESVQSGKSELEKKFMSENTMKFHPRSGKVVYDKKGQIKLVI